MKKTRQLFYQDWGTFHGTTLVACGWRDYAEPVAKLKQLKHDDRARAVDPMTENEAFAYQQLKDPDFRPAPLDPALLLPFSRKIVRCTGLRRARNPYLQ